MSEVNQKEEPQKVEKKVRTDSEKLWSSMRNKKIDMFCLPEQTVEMHCENANISPTELYLKPKTPAVLPALEITFPNLEFEATHGNKYILVMKKNVSI